MYPASGLGFTPLALLPSHRRRKPPDALDRHIQKFQTHHGPTKQCSFSRARRPFWEIHVFFFFTSDKIDPRRHHSFRSIWS